MPRVGNYWVVHTSPPTSRCPSTLKISRVLSSLLVVGMYNPINPSSRQCSYSNTNNVCLIVLCCCRNHLYICAFEVLVLGVVRGTGRQIPIEIKAEDIPPHGEPWPSATSTYTPPPPPLLLLISYFTWFTWFPWFT